MILFLNFAPIQYMGGAERKIYELFLKSNEKEKSFVITTHKKIANVYGKLVLNQTFDDRSKGKLSLNKNNSMQLSLNHFIPYTKAWSSVRNKVKNARVIYAKSELLEFLILSYFGGMNVFKNVIAGVRSPWLYKTPMNSWDRLHNFIYQSKLMRQKMKQMKYIHVLNERDKKYFENVHNLKNVIHIPNYTEIIDVKKFKSIRRNPKELRIIFIGELLSRKGIDILVKVIKNAPKNYKFDIVGDGPLREDIIKLASANPNCTYHGYMTKKEILNLLNENDILFFPSYAEGFGNVIIEAMSVGLKVVDSSNISLNLPEDIEYSVKSSNFKDYLKAFELIYKDKKENKLNRAKIRKYFADKYDIDKIMPQLLNDLFTLKMTEFKKQISI